MSANEPRARHATILKEAFDFSPPEGWEPLVERMLDGIERVDPTARVLQVKSKFGELRVFLSGQPGPEVAALVRAAEEEASRICEVCGAAGRRRGGSWVATLCDDHAKKGIS